MNKKDLSLIKGEGDFARYGFIIFTLSILPILVFWYFIEYYAETGRSKVGVFLLLCFIVVTLGYLLLRQVARRFSSLIEEIRKLQAGEEVEFKTDEGPREFREIARIATSFNEILDKLKENTSNLERIIFQITTLSEMTEFSSKISDITELLDMVLNKTMVGVNARIGSIMLLTEDNSRLRVMATRGHEQDTILNNEVKVGEGISGKVAETGEIFLVEDIEKDPRFKKQNDPKYGIGSFISMPLSVRGKIIGVLNLARKINRQTFTDNDIKFLSTSLNHLGYAVENATLLKQARDSAFKLENMVKERTRELEIAQKQVIQSEKLSALGILVAGVAHELNNPLMGIMGYSQVLLEEPLSEKVKKDLNRVLYDAKRCKRIIENLLLFSRKRAPEKRNFDISEILQDTMMLVQSQLKAEGVRLSIRPRDALPEVMVDKFQIQQVFLNIITNALHAMATRERHKEKMLVIELFVEDQMMNIKFADSGMGIPEENLNKIFDPFFTTKGADSGTGLGLSVSYGIIKQHDGDIKAESTIGVGTIFTVQLPILEKKPRIPEKKETIDEIQAGGKRILIMEEDESVLDLLEKSLKRKGFAVEIMKNNQDAAEKISQDSFDLIIIDIQMPEVKGIDLYRKVIETREDLARRFIFITGDSENEIISSFLEKIENQFVLKPFEIDALFTSIEKTFAGISVVN